jgi:hypothetical protein
MLVFSLGYEYCIRSLTKQFGKLLCGFLFTLLKEDVVVTLHKPIAKVTLKVPASKNAHSIRNL